jgi:hypothetical protein
MKWSPTMGQGVGVKLTPFVFHAMILVYCCHEKRDNESRWEEIVTEIQP